MKVLVLLCLVSMVLAGPLSQHLMSNKRTDSLTEQPQHNSSFIVGGRPADFGEAPYQVAIIIGIKLCGGSIINEHWILTAAHCVFRSTENEILIRYGSLNYNRGTIAFLSDIVVHVLYDDVTHDNDIALLRTYQPLELDYVSARAISLSRSSIYDNAPVVVSGWGLLQENNPTRPVELQIVTLYTVDQDSCRSVYPSLTDNMLCAYLDGKDACQGDSGGPLVDISRGELIGVVSFGYGCARPGIPGVYTRVPNYYQWIYDNTQILSQ